MKYKLSKEESLILRLFVEREVPDFICEIVIDNINLSEHCEELFNYSIAVLDGTDVEFGKNASGTDRACALQCWRSSENSSLHRRQAV